LSPITIGVGSLGLAWSAPSSNGSGITGYDIYRGTSSGTETLYATVGGATTSYTDLSVTGGVRYYYQVAAVNGVGEGARSAEQSGVPASGSSPDAPVLVSAQPGNSVTLTWNAPTSDGGMQITGYNVYRGTSSGGEIFLVGLGNMTSYTDETTSYGTTYYYQVTAVNGVGESARSGELSATPVAPDSTPPSKPASLKVLLTGTAQIALDWPASTDNVGVTGYQVYRNSSLVATVTTSNFLDDGLAANTTYSYYVRAIDAAGNQSLASAITSGKTVALGTGTTGTLVGVVYNAAGSPLSNVLASVTLANGSLKSQKTNASGVWQLPNLPLATYTVTLSLTGYTTQSFPMTVAAGRTLVASSVL
jgi:fibronectin type 3 domain-containing protein